MFPTRDTESRRLPRVVVTFALYSEFASWRRPGGFSKQTFQQVPIYRAQIGRADVQVVFVGVGCRREPNALRTLLIGSDVCIASGLAGGLTRQHRVGDVLVAAAVMQGNAQELSSDRELVQLAEQCGARRVAHFFTSAAIVNSLQDKTRLGANADAVEMETFHVFRQAAEIGVPAVAIRAISDASDSTIPIDFNRCIGAEGEMDWLPAVCEAARRPLQIPRLIQFGAQSSRAARNLTQFLNRYISAAVSVGNSR